MTGTAVRPSPASPPDGETDPTPAPATNDRRFGWIRRPVGACLVLLVIYVGLSIALNDSRGTLGTDTGGKLATLHVMEQQNSLVPEIGYWAQGADPKGDVHPIFYTFKVDGKWVNVTTLPMVYAAYPLFLLGGDRAALLLPMLGAVFCALAARTLARRLGAGSGWSAFWVIGLASPVAIYALDFWEHTLGLAFMLWGVVWLVRMIDERAPLWIPLVAGTCFGAAATMRTESLVYLAVCGAITCLVLLFRSRALFSTIGRGLVVLSGAVLVLLANEALERVTLGGTLRASRATSTAGGVGTSLHLRVQEALTTLAGMNRFDHTQDFVFGVMTAGLVALAVWILRRSGNRLPVAGSCALAVACFFYLIAFSAGLGFVPGMLTASPFAAVGLVLGWRADVRIVTAMAVLALPWVWAFQYSGGAGPQWGGRYTLLSGALLLVAATVALEGHRTALIAGLVAAVLVTGFGLTWLSVRSHWVASGIEHIVGRHDQAVISGEAHVLREGGAFYTTDRHWLTATNDAELHQAVAILRGTGDTEFAYVVADGVVPPKFIDGFQRAGIEHVPFLRPDLRLGVATYRLG